MHFKKQTGFVFNGKGFRSINAIQSHVENQLGSIIDKLDPHLPPKQALALLNLMIAHRGSLVELLGSTFEVETDGDSDFNENELSIWEI